ncbi:MAG: TatD family hydrolase, partial [Muribaculaceae bacterium]|nr:TatD family hydrolase [Muribaculaceae bacterium]
HIVRAFPEIIRLRRQEQPTQRWIIHGFRGKPELARELLRHGFDISIGREFNTASAAIIPPDRLFHETD